MKKLIKPLGFLILMILVCSVIVRLTSGSETLSDYAKKNPELAYATPKAQPGEASTSQPIAAQNEKSSATASAQLTVSTDAPTAEVTASLSPSPSASPSQTPSPFLPLEKETADSTHYADGFFYQPLTDAVIARITGISYPVFESIAPLLSLDAINVLPDREMETLPVAYDDLRYMNVLYYDFDGKVQTGELICNKGIAQDLIEIFHELYLNEYQLAGIRLIDEYGGNDTASMEANNTSCFNYRVVDGTASLSKHALGCAIDINPLYNPYVVFNKDGSGETCISPEGSEKYADRSLSFP